MDKAHDLYSPKVSSCLNWYPTTPWPNQRYVSLFVLIWMVSIPFRSMTSIKENAFEIWRANLHYFRATLIIVVNKVLCCARRGTLGSTKNWQIPKYRVKNRRNADTTCMIGHVVSISRVCLPQACMHQKWTSDISTKRRFDRYKDQKAR